MLESLKQLEWMGNPVASWLVALAAALIGFGVASGVLGLLRSQARRFEQHLPEPAARAARPLHVVVNTTRNWILLLLSSAFATEFLDLPRSIEAIVHNATFALVGVQVALWINALIELWLSRPSAADGKPRGNPVMTGILRWSAQLVVWTTLLMAMLANAGVDITAFVASLGIGGVAVALALQSLLGDLFSSISIGLDKPFEVGEFIAFGNDLGTVRNVGIKSTRIDSLRGEQLVISNSKLLEQLVRNYSRMPHRRVVFGFRLPYGTTSERVLQVVEGVKEIIRAQQDVRFDRGHQSAFGEYGLAFEFVYYVLSSDYAMYMDVQQRINLAIIDLLDAKGLAFAVPARYVRIDSDDADPAQPRSTQRDRRAFMQP
ncbi:MAG: mechanosensitive ion channel family protein [Burkholderiaceae bacterium]|nr:mechanosensitive ion channel family protein [Burkholderiaceae bacterium]